MRNTVTKKYKNVKQAIRKKNPVDTYFVSRYSFSPYMACQHACKYCDGRAEKYYVEGDYEKDIVIRRNLPELLQKELPKLREKGIISIGSGISDPYQPVEAEEKLLRKSLKNLLQHNYSVTILTKSSLILRDWDLLKQINSKNGVLLMMSVTTLDDQIRKIFEPGASSIEERLATLQQFHNSGIATGILAMPFLPYISDSTECMLKLFQKAKEVGVDFILPGFLTLRPGIQKQTYLEVINNYYPKLGNDYFKLYNNNLKSGNPLKKYRDKLDQKAYELLEVAQLPYLIPPYIYRNRLTLPDEVYVLLDHLKFLYKRKNVDISRLIRSFDNYAKWLLEKRKYFSRRRNLPRNYLDDQLLQAFTSGEMLKIIDNRKLYQFLIEVVRHRRIFNYQKLKFD